jgi:hypothetical protein
VRKRAHHDLHLTFANDTYLVTDSITAIEDAIAVPASIPLPHAFPNSVPNHALEEPDYISLLEQCLDQAANATELIIADEPLQTSKCEPHLLNTRADAEGR